MVKKLKDPIYGYIKIPVEYMTNIVDTAEFQRLRRIMQTSYSPLYSSAIHNRFVHSIGVFYLGGIASEQIKSEIVRKKFMDEAEVTNLASIYRLACLLHDVGHAPFSHTGECFYKNKEFQCTDLHERIAGLVGSDSFTEELKNTNVKPAAPHELMSVIVGLNKYGEFLPKSEDKEFFARCITGYCYDNSTKENQIKNCFVSMLNSKVIDVDRLDYLIRDAYISGFETVNIDYLRLLQALTVVYYNNRYQLAYKKDALSIIENVVYAHDAEKKWIQNHPVVLYEAYIIKHIIMHLNEKLTPTDQTNGKSFFSEEALSAEGVVLNKKIKVSLLCDDDIVYLYKNVFPDELSSEFLHRQKRRHPIWKSEAEYRGYIAKLSQAQLKDKFDEYIENMTKGEFKDIPSFTVIDKAYINKVNKELRDAKKELKAAEGNPVKKESVENNIKGIKSRRTFCTKLKDFADKNGIDCDFIVLKADIFSSSFSKEYLGNTLIVFKDGDKENIFKINDVCNTLKAEQTEGDMFYIFYRKKGSGEIAGIKDFCVNLFMDTVSSLVKS